MDRRVAVITSICPMNGGKGTVNSRKPGQWFCPANQARPEQPWLIVQLVFPGFQSPISGP
jgi:hypothetical protein